MFLREFGEKPLRHSGFSDVKTALKGLKIAEIPVKFPDNREHSEETGSHRTEHTRDN